MFKKWFANKQESSNKEPEKKVKPLLAEDWQTSNDLELLINAYPQHQHAVAERIDLLYSGMPEHEQQLWLRELPAHSELVLDLLHFTQHPALVDALLNRCPQEARQALLHDSRSAIVKRSIIEALDDLETVKHWQQYGKNKDKSIYQAARDRLAVLQKEAELEEQFSAYTTEQVQLMNGQDSQALLAAIERWRAFVPYLDRLHDQEKKDYFLKVLQEAEGIRGHADERLRKRLEINRQLLDLIERIERGEVDPKNKEEKIALDSAWQEYLEPENDRSISEHRQLQNRYDTLLQQRRQAHEEDSLLQAWKKDVHSLLQQEGFVSENKINRLLERSDQLSGQLSHETWRRQHDSVAHLKQNLSQRLNQQRQEQKKQKETLDEALAAFIAAMEHGQLKEASEHKQTVEESLHSGFLLPRVQSEAERRMRPYLNQYHEWQGLNQQGELQFLDDLIAMGKSLVHAPYEMNVQQKKITALRQQWKETTAHLPHRQYADLKKEFDEVMKQAHAHVKQGRQRIANEQAQALAQRQEICRQLQALSERDVRQKDQAAAVAEELKKLKKAWKNAGSVQARAWKSIHPQYRDALEAVYQHLDGMRREEWQRRAALIEDLRAMQGQPPAKVFALIKDIQKQWKPCVESRFKDEQELWRSFRKEVDQAVAASEQLREQINADRAANLSAIKELNQTISTALNDETLDAYALQKNIEDALHNIQLNDLHHKNQVVQEFHNLQSEVQRRLAWADAASFFQELQALRDKRALQRRSNSEPANNDSVQHLQMYAARAELIAGLPLSAEDEALRLQINVMRLQDKLSQASTQLEALRVFNDDILNELVFLETQALQWNLASSDTVEACYQRIAHAVQHYIERAIQPKSHAQTQKTSSPAEAPNAEAQCHEATEEAQASAEVSETDESTVVVAATDAGEHAVEEHLPDAVDEKQTLSVDHEEKSTTEWSKPAVKEMDEEADESFQ